MIKNASDHPYWLAIFSLLFLSRIIQTATAAEIYESQLAGRWQSLGPEGASVLSVVVDPKNPQNLYLIAESQPPILFKSTNGGDTWQQVGVFSEYMRKLQIDPNNPATLYSTCSRSFYKSENSGVTWKGVEVTATNCYFIDIQVAPSNPKIIFLFGYQFDGNQNKIAVFKTENGGTSFRPVYLSTSTMSAYIYATAIDPIDPKYVYYSNMYYNDSVYKYEFNRSSDGGEHWQSISSGINNAVEAIAIDPVQSNKIYVGTCNCVFRSENRGDSWKTNSGWINCSALVIDPKNPQTLYAGYYGTIFKSTDGGVIWTKYMSNLNIYCQQLAIDPLQPQNLYYASIIGMFKSTNGGVDWSAKNSGLIATTITAISPAASDPDQVYIEVENDAVFKTEDLGATWKRLSIFLSCGNIGALAVHPTLPQTVYALEGAG